VPPDGFDVWIARPVLAPLPAAGFALARTVIGACRVAVLVVTLGAESSCQIPPRWLPDGIFSFPAVQLELLPATTPRAAGVVVFGAPAPQELAPPLDPQVSWAGADNTPIMHPAAITAMVNALLNFESSRVDS
jgi:hypothetical protein